MENDDGDQHVSHEVQFLIYVVFTGFIGLLFIFFFLKKVITRVPSPSKAPLAGSGVPGTGNSLPSSGHTGCFRRPGRISHTRLTTMIWQKRSPFNTGPRWERVPVLIFRCTWTAFQAMIRHYRTPPRRFLRTVLLPATLLYHLAEVAC